jgi:hypothetical protein
LWFVNFYTCFPCFGRNCYCCIFLFICFSGILLLLTVKVYIFPVELKAKWSISYYKLRRKSPVINRTSFVILVVVWSWFSRDNGGFAFPLIVSTLIALIFKPLHLKLLIFFEFHTHLLILFLPPFFYIPFVLLTFLVSCYCVCVIIASRRLYRAFNKRTWPTFWLRRAQTQEVGPWSSQAL